MTYFLISPSKEMGCDPSVIQTLSELLMLKAHIICAGKGFKSNMEHPKASAAAVDAENLHSESVSCEVLFILFKISCLIMFYCSAKEP